MPRRRGGVRLSADLVPSAEPADCGATNANERTLFGSTIGDSERGRVPPVPSLVWSRFAYSHSTEWRHEVGRQPDKGGGGKSEI